LLALRKSYDVDLSLHVNAIEGNTLTLQDDIEPFQRFMQQRLDATLGEYLLALQEAIAPPTERR
jgi:hypothetical protein